MGQQLTPPNPSAPPPGSYFPTTIAADQALFQQLALNFRLDAQIPQWPFASAGRTYFCDWVESADQDFADLLAVLCEAHGDEYVIVGTAMDGGVRTIKRLIGLAPVFRIDADQLASSYFDCLDYQPGGIYGTNNIYPPWQVFLAAGNTGKWAVFGESGPELTVVRTDAEGDPLATFDHPTVRLLSWQEAIDACVLPARRGRPLTEAEHAEYLENFRLIPERSTGPQEVSHVWPEGVRWAKGPRATEAAGELRHHPAFYWGRRRGL